MTRLPSVPSVLVECGFLSNPEDERDRKAVPELDPYYVFRDTPEMRRTLYAIEYPGFPCYLVGPTGCGKTTLVEQLCARLQRPVTRVNLDSGLGRSDFVGIWVFKADQSMSFQHGPVSTAIRDGHVLILDEMGYVNFNRHQSELLFDVFSERSERGSIIYAVADIDCAF